MARNETVAHAWAHQAGCYGSGNSMRWNGPTAYSYGMPVAHRADGADGEVAILITTDRPSNSTAVHVGLLRDACRHLRRFDVPHVRPDSLARHGENHQAIVFRAIDAVQRAGRARTQAASWLDKAQRAVDDANAYAAAFALPFEPVEFDHLDRAAAEAQRRAEEQREAEGIARRRSEAMARLSRRDKVRAWMRGEPVHVRTPIPMVRVIGDRVETTWGASASLADALAAYRAAKACRRVGRAVDGPQVDQWGRASIDAKGTITVGCLRIPFRLAQLAACLAGLDQSAA